MLATTLLLLFVAVFRKTSLTANRAVGQVYLSSLNALAARIMDESAGGQILVSGLLRQVANGPSNSEHEYTDFGRRTLKGFDEEEQIFEVQWKESTT